MDQFIVFVQDRWIVILVAIVALFIVVKIVKTMMKWIIVLVIAAGLLIYGANYVGDLKQISAKIIDYSKEEAVKALVNEAKKANYQDVGDGHFTVGTQHIQLAGQYGSDEATITFYDYASFQIKLDETLQKIISESQDQ